MRVPLLAALLLLSVPLVGCLGDPQEPAALEPEAGEGTPATELVPGTALRYEAHGAWDLVETFTIVVAQADRDGYLLAGETPDDLLGEVFLERAWFGERSLELNRHPTAGHPEGWQLFDFPLTDGKTWTRGQQVVTARQANVSTPTDVEPGFVMEVGDPSFGDDDFHIEYTYAPSVGYLTRYTYTWAGRTVFDIRLVDVGTAETWTWYAAGRAAELTGDRDLSVLPYQMPQGFDDLVVYAGGDPGTTATLQKPIAAGDEAAPWLYTVDGASRAFTAERLPATEGTWTATLDRPEDGEAYLALVPVVWEQNGQD